MTRTWTGLLWQLFESISHSPVNFDEMPACEVLFPFCRFCPCFQSFHQPGDDDPASSRSPFMAFSCSFVSYLRQFCQPRIYIRIPYWVHLLLRAFHSQDNSFNDNSRKRKSLICLNISESWLFSSCCFGFLHHEIPDDNDDDDGDRSFQLFTADPCFHRCPFFPVFVHSSSSSLLVLVPFFIYFSLISSSSSFSCFWRFGCLFLLFMTVFIHGCCNCFRC